MNNFQVVILMVLSACLSFLLLDALEQILEPQTKDEKPNKAWLIIQKLKKYFTGRYT